MLFLLFIRKMYWKFLIVNFLRFLQLILKLLQLELQMRIKFYFTNRRSHFRCVNCKFGFSYSSKLKLFYSPVVLWNVFGFGSGARKWERNCELFFKRSKEIIFCIIVWQHRTVNEFWEQYFPAAEPCSYVV